MSATGRTPLPGVQRYRVAAPVPGSPPTVSTKVWPRPPTSTAGARNCSGTLPSRVTDPACLPLVVSWLNDPSLSAYTTRPAGPTATPRGPSSPSTTGTRLLAPTAADAPPAINTPAVTAAATSRAVLLRSLLCIQHPPMSGADRGGPRSEPGSGCKQLGQRRHDDLTEQLAFALQIGVGAGDRLDGLGDELVVLDVGGGVVVVEHGREHHPPHVPDGHGAIRQPDLLRDTGDRRPDGDSAIPVVDHGQVLDSTGEAHGDRLAGLGVGEGDRAWAGGLEQREPALGQPHDDVLDDVDGDGDRDVADLAREGLHDVLMGPLKRLGRGRLDHGQEQAAGQHRRERAEPCASSAGDGRPSWRTHRDPPLFWREAGVARARRANLRRSIRLVNGLVVALDLRCGGRVSALIGVLLVVHLATSVGTRHATNG